MYSTKLEQLIECFKQIIYDLQQIGREELVPLRDSLLSLLHGVRAGRQNRVVRTQLNVCLAILAIQMTEWKNVIELVVNTLGQDADGSICLLEFLKVLPEEVTEGRRIRMTVSLQNVNFYESMG